MSIQQYCNNFKCNRFIEKPCITGRHLSFLWGQRKVYLRNFRQRQQKCGWHCEPAKCKKGNQCYFCVHKDTCKDKRNKYQI